MWWLTFVPLMNLVCILGDFLLHFILFLFKIELRYYSPAHEVIGNNIYEQICQSYLFALKYNYDCYSPEHNIRKPINFIVGSRYIAYVELQLSSHNKEGYHIHLLCRPGFTSIPLDDKHKKKQATVNDTTACCVADDTISYLLQQKPYKGAAWDIVPQRVHFTASDEQVHLLKQVSEILDKKTDKDPYNLILFISGESRTGKSYFGKILCQHLNGVLCDTYYPTEYGSGFFDIYYTVRPSKHRPLIVLLNEIDVIFDTFQYRQSSGASSHDMYYKRDVWNKCSWNNWMDRWSKEDYVIFILTSNFTIEELRSGYDPSMTRLGRIHLFSHFQYVIPSSAFSI